MGTGYALATQQFCIDEGISRVKAWWTKFYDVTVASYILKELRPGELEYVVSALQLEPGDSCFDQCCGWGRVAGPLSLMGISCFGVDSQADLIANARERWKSPRAVFTCADAREFSPPELCQGGLNLYTSFGYCLDDEENRRVLSQLVNSVKPGKRVVLDLANAAKIRRDFKGDFEVRGPLDCRIRRRSRLSDGRTLHQEWEFKPPHGAAFTRESLLQLYDADEIAGMLEGVGGELLECRGDFDAAPYDETSERLIVVARRV